MKGTVNGMQHFLGIRRTGEYSRRARIAGIAVIDFGDFGLSFQNRIINVPFKLGYVGFGVLISGIPLPKNPQNECGLSFAILTDPFSYVSLSSFAWPATNSCDCNQLMQYNVSPAVLLKVQRKIDQRSSLAQKLPLPSTLQSARSSTKNLPYDFH